MSSPFLSLVFVCVGLALEYDVRRFNTTYNVFLLSFSYPTKADAYIANTPITNHGIIRTQNMTRNLVPRVSLSRGPTSINSSLTSNR